MSLTLHWDLFATFSGAGILYPKGEYKGNLTSWITCVFCKTVWQNSDSCTSALPLLSHPPTLISTATSCVHSLDNLPESPTAKVIDQNSATGTIKFVCCNGDERDTTIPTTVTKAMPSSWHMFHEIGVLTEPSLWRKTEDLLTYDGERGPWERV